MQYKYKIQNRETGTEIDYYISEEEAEEALEQFEQEDIEAGEFTENFYEIVEIKQEEI